MASRTVIQTDQAPKAIGPYSQAVSVPAGKMVFCSGQIPLDPASGNMVTGDIAAETERVMKNLEAVLAASGLGFGQVVRCGIFLTDLNDFAKVNEVYARFFPTAPPARATVQVSALPKGARVEIDCIAVG
ncbi:MAG: RidA family protein [Myxococcaceae bacterium]